MKGIDISSYQGVIDWSKVKVDFAIIRLGYGDNIEKQDDTQFLNNVRGCIASDIPFGVYLYSYAKNLAGEESIASEIEHCKRLLSKIEKKPFCVYIDMEDDSIIYLKKLMLTNFALEFCKKMTEAGYRAGVYANENWCKNYLNVSTIASYGYSIWCAKYSSNKPNITSNYDIWQYSSAGKIDGINGNVDMNECYNSELIASQKSNTTTQKEVNVYYKVKTLRHNWLPEVRNLEDYAGYQNSPITGLAIKVDNGSIKYRVHRAGKGWLPYVTGYDINNSTNGYAGDGKSAIDLVEVYYYTPSYIRPYKCAYYKVNDFPYQKDNVKDSKNDGYAGKIGTYATKFQIEIK